MSLMTSTAAESSSERASIHSIVSSASVTLAGWSGGSPNRAATARCNRRSASRYGLKGGKFLQGSGHVAEIGLAGVVQQTPKCVLRSAMLADADGVLGDTVKLP